MEDRIHVSKFCLVALISIGFMLISSGTSNAGDKKNHGPSKGHAKINCDIQNGACRQMIKDRAVTLEVLPKPVKAMSDLTFLVTVDGPPLEVQPYIDLNMPAMDMGKNRVALKLNKDGVYEGKGVIVRCRSGRRTWQAKVTCPNIGSAGFIFDVVY